MNASIRGIMSEYGIYAKKNYGQHFLADNHVLSKIIKAANINKNDFVIEIGAGLGALTSELCKNAGKVVAFEIDNALLPALNGVLSEFNNVEVINEDVLKADFSRILSENNVKSYKIAANLPYYITTPIIFKAFEEKIPIENMTIMVQKEVADRMLAKPSSKNYGALTVGVNYYSDVSLVANVPKNCFVPRPDIDSAVIKLTFHSPPVLENEEAFFLTVKAAFSKRRKTLVNCLCNFDGYGKFKKPSKQQALKIVQNCGLDENIRGEELSVQHFVSLSNEYFGSVY